MNIELKQTRYTTHLLRYHIVFVVKYRKKIFTDKMLKDIEEWIKDIIISNCIDLIEFNGEKDHVHILIECGATHPPLFNLVNMLKSATSKRLRRKYPGVKKVLYGDKIGLWSRNYFIATVGNVSLDMVKRYIEKQKRPL